MSYPTPRERAYIVKATALGKTHIMGGHHALNLIAGTTNWPEVGALNVIAGNSTAAYRDLEGVLNQLAGTKGWGADGAAGRWAGVV